MHPLDLVKVRFQIADKGKGLSRAPSAGFGREVYGAMREAVTKDGWRGLYRGLSPNVAGNASSWGLYFLLCVFSRASSEEGRVTVRRTK
jgi:solute carrier family 25 folate transporter 32